MFFNLLTRIIAMLIQKTFTENKQLVMQIAGDVEALGAEERKMNLEKFGYHSGPACPQTACYC